MCFTLKEQLMGEMDEKAKEGNESVKEWLRAFVELGKKLGIKVD
jgi:hypothetical protein